jgi:aminopeptidase N
MVESYLGEGTFREGVRGHLQRHQHGIATSSEFFAALSVAAKQPAVVAAFRSFVEQPGVPLVEHTLVCDPTPRLELRQKRSLPAGTTETVARTWQVPVCVRYGGAAASDEAHRACVLLAAAEGTLPLAGGCPGWLLMNAEGVGYYRSRYGEDELRALVGPSAAARTTMAERAVVLSDIDAAVARDQLGIADAMALVPGVLADPDDRIRRRASLLTGQLDANALDDGTYARYESWVAATFGPTARDLGWRRCAGDTDERQELRAEVVYAVAWAGDRELRAEAGRLARAWLADPKALEDDVVDRVLAVAARDGDAGLFDEILAQATAETDRARQTRLLKALGSFRDEALAKRALDLVLGRGFDLRESRATVFAVTGTRETRELGWRYIQDHVDGLLGALRSDEGSWFVGDAAGLFCDETHRKEADALFSPRVGKIEGSQYALRQALDKTDQCIARQARILPDVTAFLAGY